MHTEPFRIRVNDRHELEAQPSDARQLDIAMNPDGSFHVLRDGKSCTATLVDADALNRTYTFRIDGEAYKVHIADHYERLIQQLGLSIGGSHKQNTVKAPMPGLVLQIAVEPGQAVSKGDTLLILEAMKMENVLKSAGDGVVKSIQVKQGAAVDKGQLLIEME
ncbi:MAG: biotin/lipoyl-binding protein [Saprospiraceae bacterium]|nr:biotin/lipoyl-binding protein [Saprospiraceae bacterium]